MAISCSSQLVWKKDVAQSFGIFIFMEKKGFFGLFSKGKKEVGVTTAIEETRDGQPKAVINDFYYKPPFGYPRYKDLNYYRILASSIYVDMAETAIIDEVCSVNWDIVAEDKAGNEIEGKESQIEEIRDFFENPNTNKESFEDLLRMMLPDLMEINSGIWVKVFDSFGKMVELVSRDGASFTKNPDMYGMYTNRADLILMRDIVKPTSETEVTPNPMIMGTMNPEDAKNEAAYFQYGWNTAHRPVPFGKREIVWFEKKKRTDDLYGRSIMEVLAKTVQTLIYAVEHNLEYFNDNSIPPGVLGLEGMNTEDVKAFGKQWNEVQKVQDENGYWKKAFHKLPIVNKVPKFERLSFTNQELQIIEQQKWWAKLVWACFGITSTELGFTEDAKGNANQIVQSSIAKKRIIYPLLRLIEYHINTEIVPEFGYEGIRFKFKIFDVDEETKKWNLYKLQVQDSKIKTINEIRNSEGLDPIEGGDEIQGNQNGNNFYMNGMEQENSRTNRDFQNQRDQMTGNANKPAEEKSIETKPGMGHSDKWWEVYHALMREGHDKESAARIANSRIDKKENELKKAIIEVLRKNKQKVIEALEQNDQKDQLIKIKGLGDVPGFIKKFFGVFTLKQISDEIIKSEFMSGWDKAEKQIDRNIQFNQKALDFLQNYTFDNIKGMTEEIANDLKQELERGIINGEGITKLKGRVNSVFNKGENRAEMISRTETNRADNQGKLLAMKGSGIDMKKKVVVAHDDRTSALCKRMDGQVVGLNDKFKDPLTGEEWESPPFHVNCRSSVVFMTD